MAGTYIKPKAFNRRIFLNLGTAEAPDFAEIAAGISSRGGSFTEESEDFYYMANRGVAESEPKNQKVSRTFSGNRFIGDAAQDEIFLARLYDLNNRQVEYLEFYDNIDAAPNGWKGSATIFVTDDGSGDTASRETIGFNLAINGAPTRGTVVMTSGKPVFTPEANA